MLENTKNRRRVSRPIKIIFVGLLTGLAALLVLLLMQSSIFLISLYLFMLFGLLVAVPCLIILRSADHEEVERRRQRGS